MIRDQDERRTELEDSDLTMEVTNAVTYERRECPIILLPMCFTC